MSGARRRYFSIYTGPRAEAQDLSERHIRSIGGEPVMRGTVHIYGWITARDAIDALIQLQDAAPDHGYKPLDVIERG